MQKRWLVADPITPQAEDNLQAYHPVLRQLLFNRGIGSADAAASFVTCQPGFDTNPMQMVGMKASVERIAVAVKLHEPIVVYGDYDVDGVTATALLIQMLEAVGAAAKAYIPNRFDEGYGLNTEALDLLKAEGARLVITVDCGIRSPEEARHAGDIGLDLIITDHHHPADGALPPAMAILNPKQPGDEYPEKNLAGVGIAYKLAEALVAELLGTHVPDSQLDLVALGTVADLAPLVGENRHLVRRGLEEIRHTHRQGLYSLAQVASLQINKTTAGNIGFVLGPRLNAAGRLKSAKAALELLLTDDPRRAGRLAQELEANNQERQAVTRADPGGGRAAGHVRRRAACTSFCSPRGFQRGRRRAGGLEARGGALSPGCGGRQRSRGNAGLVPINPGVPHHGCSGQMCRSARAARGACRGRGIHSEKYQPAGAYRATQEPGRGRARST